MRRGDQKLHDEVALRCGRGPADAAAGGGALFVGQDQPTAINASFEVPGGSSGDVMAIVMTLQMITVRINGSKSHDSTNRMHAFRGADDTDRQKKDLSWYRLPEGPCTASAGDSQLSASRPGSFALSGPGDPLSLP